jgi:CRP-like cAMP-binding protein
MANSAEAPQGPSARRLKKGELLFSEGEKSRSMYFLRAGMIRIFKRKGTSQIELDTIHSGQVLGELAFLDGNPRSASGEALVDCDLVEVSGQTFLQEMSKMPEWLKILLKTIVGRLRSASTRIRQLESASTGVDYSDKTAGVRASNYFYLSPIDVLKIMTAVLLVGSRAKTTGTSIELPQALLIRYGNQIMGVPAAKITTLLGVLETLGLANLNENADRTIVHDLPFIERLIVYFNSENLSESSKRHDLTPRAYSIMGLIVKYLDQFSKDPTTGQITVNLMKIKELEAAAVGKKDPFRMDDFAQLVSVGYCTTLDMKSASEMNTTLSAEDFCLNYRFQSFAMAIATINEQKRNPTAVAA